MDHIPCHFEILGEDCQKLVEFYSKLFGWKITQMDMGADGVYYMIDTGEGGIKGGIMKRPHPQAVGCNYILVESVDDYSKGVVENGGQVVFPKHAVPGMGYFAVCIDPEENAFGIWEQNPQAK